MKLQKLGPAGLSVTLLLTPNASLAAAPPEGDDTSGPWLQRYRPSQHMITGGVYGGLFIPSEEHDFYDPLTRPAAPLWRLAADLGLRLAYAPLPYLEVEGEFSAIPARARTPNDDFVFMYSARGHLLAQLPFWSVSPFVLAGVGAGGVRSNLLVLGDDDDFLVHWGAGLKVFLNKWLSLRLDGRHLMGALAAEQNDVTHHFEVLAGVGFSWRPKAKPPKDRDHDGVFDRRDKCPDEAGPAPSGCPIRDADGDGILDPDDQCPNEVGPAPSGCPTRDADGDGILDPDDKCPDEAETKNGFEDQDGCPDELPKAVEEFSGVIEGIAFGYNSAEILPSSRATLDRAIDALRRFPEIRVEIVGHTDNVGGDEFNRDLSLQRADAVRAYLVEGGVKAERLSTRGAGASEPRADNDSEAGRAKNRRTEFKILTD